MNKELVKKYNSEESKFKVNDWVKLPGSELDRIYEVTTNTICLSHFGSIGVYTDTYSKLELWKPQPSEWCWFWNNDKQPFLAQLEYFNDDEYITLNGLHGSLDDLSDACFSFEYCEPFIGKLPTPLQEQ